MTEAISVDLGLDTHQISNSNILSLLSTLIVRLVIGPVVDAFGPRWTLAALLVLGAVPSSLVPLIRNVSGMFAARFFIGLLGGTFVPCQVWAVSFFSQGVVGRANALVGGWGNVGGGVTFLIMVSEPPLPITRWLCRGRSCRRCRSRGGRRRGTRSCLTRAGQWAGPKWWASRLGWGEGAPLGKLGRD